MRASPDQVWRALTDSKEISGWFGQATSFTPEVGADGWFEWTGEGRYHARIERVELGRAISWRWARHENVDVDEGESTLVEWNLEPSPRGGTILWLRESGFGEAPHRSGNAQGWLEELADLAAHVAQEPWQAGIRKTYSFRASPERLWRALSDPEELQAWQGFTEFTTTELGVDGWVIFGDAFRMAIRVEAMEPPTYIATSRPGQPNQSFADATEILLTEFFVTARPDGGSDLLLFESGHVVPDGVERNAVGWDADLIPAIRGYLDES